MPRWKPSLSEFWESNLLFPQVCDLSYWSIRFLEFRRLSCVCWGKAPFNIYWELVLSVSEGKMGSLMEDVCKEWFPPVIKAFTGRFLETATSRCRWLKKKFPEWAVKGLGRSGYLNAAEGIACQVHVVTVTAHRRLDVGRWVCKKSMGGLVTRSPLGLWYLILEITRGLQKCFLFCILHLKGNITIKIRGRIGGAKFKT